MLAFIMSLFFWLIKGRREGLSFWDVYRSATSDEEEFEESFGGVSVSVGLGRGEEARFGETGSYYHDNRSELPRWKLVSGLQQFESFTEVRRWCVLDVETTGIYESHRICELAMRHMGDSGNEWQSYFNPGMKSSPVARGLHGLSDRFLSKQVEFFQRAQNVLAFMEGCRLVGWNLNFDLAHLGMEFHRAGVTVPSSVLGIYHVDAMRVASFVCPGAPRKLNEFAKSQGVSLRGAKLHSASGDVLLLCRVWEFLLSRLQAQILDKSSELQQAVDLDVRATENSLLYPIEGKRIAFVGNFKCMGRLRKDDSAESLGAVVIPEVSKNLDFVVVGINPESAELARIEELEIPVVRGERWKIFVKRELRDQELRRDLVKLGNEIGSNGDEVALRWAAEMQLAADNGMTRKAGYSEISARYGVKNAAVSRFLSSRIGGGLVIPKDHTRWMPPGMRRFALKQAEVDGA